MERLKLLLLYGVCGGLCGLLSACGTNQGHGDPPPDLATSNPDAGTPGDLLPAVFNDFPAAPVIDPTGTTPAPASAPSLFGAAGSGAQSGGPCLVDPEPGTLLPQNWLRPRFHFIAPAGENLFEIRLHAANQMSDLVVYTSQTTWTMDPTTWGGLAEHTVDQPITVTVRGAVFDGTQLTSGPALGGSGTFTIAPVQAEGAIVYWTTTGGSALRGFSIGDETVHDVLTPSQAGTACVGCHASTPDGLDVAFSASADPGNGDPASIEMRSVDGQLTTPSFLSAAAKTLLARTYQELPVFSKAHFQTGDRVALTMMPVANVSEIIWTDLEASSTTQGMGWGVLSRGGDPGQAAGASFSHDGKSVVYSSAAKVVTGITVGDGDLRIVPYGNRMGGTSIAVPGASDPNYNEFYPIFSPDDAWLAFDRLPAGQDSYNNGSSEVFVIPTAGGTATRLAANDPPMCSGKVSPGVTNSWPKWSPNVQTIGARTFYWITFSSTRGDGGNPQIYVAPVVIENGQVKSYPALYLWNQPADQNNHTPAWDNFQIPIG